MNKRKENQHLLMNYKEAYNILMKYWDYFPDEDKPEIDRRLKELGL